MKVDFKVMSNQKCSCGNYLKQNIVDRRKDPICYNCHAQKENNRGHKIAQFGGPRLKRIQAGLPVK